MMAQLQTSAILIRVELLGETGRFVTLFIKMPLAHQAVNV
jgi:hypothetical protein